MPQKKLDFNLKLLFLINWTLFVLILLTMPSATVEKISITYIDKLVHMLMFGIFSYLIILTFVDRIKKNILHIVSILLGIGYAFLGEYLQLFIPTRTTSDADFYAGVIGVIIFVYIASRGNK